MGLIGQLSKKLIALEKPFPPFLKARSEIVVTVAVLFILWLEVVTDMRGSPFNLGLLLLAITLLSIGFAVIFERQTWCRYLCPLGGLSGLMAKASVIELRADRNVCSSKCGTHECYLGNEERPGCPFGHITTALNSNLDCKICGICIKNCPYGAININLRIPGWELMETQRSSSAMAFLSVAIPGALLAELAYQAPTCSALQDYLGLTEPTLFTVLFLSGIAAANLIVLAAALLSHLFLTDNTRHNYTVFGIALIPLTLASLLAHHVWYLINLGVQLPVLLSRRFDLAFFQDLIITLSPETTSLVQKTIIITGFVWTALIMMSIARNSVESRISAVLGLIPHLATSSMIALSVLHAMELSAH